jgi:hypothetical protein
MQLRGLHWRGRGKPASSSSAEKPNLSAPGGESTEIRPDDEQALRAAIQAAYIDVAKGKLDRASSSADFVKTAAGAIGTLYTGLLALVYSVASTPARPLPARALAPAIFLALAFLFSVVNIAFVRSRGEAFHLLPIAETWEQQEQRLAKFIQWMEVGARRRGWAIRCAVVFLGAAIALLPLPFISISTTASRVTIGVVAVLAAAYFVYEVRTSKNEGRPPASHPPTGKAKKAK